jgi:hypothetical protein
LKAKKRMNIIPAIRVDSSNPDHHLWNNHGTWWCHFTLHLPDFTKQRIRTSLDTASPKEARELRDGLLALFGTRVDAGRNVG